MSRNHGQVRPKSRRSARAGPRKWLRQHSTTSLLLGSLAIFTAVAVAGGSLVVYIKYRAVWDGITRVNVSADLTGKRPPLDPHALNILIIGSDSRAGVNGRIGGRANIAGARSDTDMVLHIAPGAHQVVVLSIPRDSVVPIVDCSREGSLLGQTAQPAGAVEQINATFANGGPGCLWKTIEQTTGIHINDFVQLTFIGFEKAIDSLGGVSVCLPGAVNDPVSGLRLSAGRHHVYGRQALAFWRTREGVGMGDDPQRIQRDQYLMAALVQGIEHSGLLRSPSKMLHVVDALTGHGYLSTDSGLTASRMLQIAEAMRGISAGAVQFVTVPWTAYQPNTNWVQWMRPTAGKLFAAIAHDTKLPKAPKAAKGAKKAKKATTVKPSQVRVAVFNGGMAKGLGASTATALAARGFKVIGPAANAATNTYRNSVIEYGSVAQLPAAQTLAQQVGANVTLRLDPQLGSAALHLIIGSAFTALPSAAGKTGGTGSSIQNLAGTYGGITGSTKICSDQNAFAGPLGY
jgi:LCP family protein required for cell wall assembly